MVNIKAIIVIDKDNQVIIHNSWADMQQYDLNQATTQFRKTRISDEIREFVRRARNLEDRYHLPRGSLEGIHLITGSSIELARKLHRPDIVNLLTSSTDIFIIKMRQGDPVIRTTIHTNGQTINWEYFNDGAILTNWRNIKFPDETDRTD